MLCRSTNRNILQKISGRLIYNTTTTYKNFYNFTSMASSTTKDQRTYGDAITALNSLQTNFAVLEAIRKNVPDMNARAMPETIEWFNRIGYKPADFDKLNIIHVAGTKGKGSTCAFASSILKQYCDSEGHTFPRKTGLYTSPHLKSVRERIRINNKPISEALFAKYFFQVFDRVQVAMAEGKLAPEQKPAYFRFLTMVALHVYLQEGVDTVILEVGVGGEYDSTNIIEKPTVTGVTSLGIDHVAILGDTIEKIAWQKAGIFKKGAKAFTVQQKEGAMQVLLDRAKERETTLELVEINPEVAKLKLGLAGSFQQSNASLAVALVADHLQKLGINVSSKPLPDLFTKGLEQATWPGRCQIIREKNVEWCIDGAHTKESVEVAAQWFASVLKENVQNRVLYFNQQTRDAPALVLYLKQVLSEQMNTGKMFDHVIFSSNTTYKDTGAKADLMSAMNDAKAVSEMTVQKGLATAWQSVDSQAKVHVISTIEESVDFMRNLQGSTQVLVTGSLHLVGGFLDVVEDDEDE